MFSQTGSIKTAGGGGGVGGGGTRVVHTGTKNKLRLDIIYGHQYQIKKRTS